MSKPALKHTPRKSTATFFPEERVEPEPEREDKSKRKTKRRKKVDPERRTTWFHDG